MAYVFRRPWSFHIRRHGLGVDPGIFPAPAGTVAAAGSATGLAAVTASGASIVAEPGSSTGFATVTAVGASINAGAGSSTGSATVTAVGRSTAAASGAASGAAIVSAVGASTEAGAGSAAGSASVTAVGSATEAAAGSSAGSATVTATGAATKAAAGAASGAGTATGTGAETAAAAGTAIGSGTAIAGGAETFAAVGSSTAAGSASAVGASIEAAAGSAAGTGTASAVGASTAAAVGSASGTSTVLGVPAGVVTWNSADKDANITLSNGSLTAVNTLTGDRLVRATIGRSTPGYFELSFATLAGGAFGAEIGFNNTSESTGSYIGKTTNGVGYAYNGITVWNDTTPDTGLLTFGVNDVVGGELVSDSTFKFYVNGVLAVHTTVSRPGTVFPALDIATGYSGTANFGATPMLYLPAGVTSWDGSQVGVAGRATGSASGTSAATAIGAEIAAAAGAATGSATVTAIGRGVVPATGAAAGSATVAGNGLVVAVGTGSAAGSATVAGAGAETGIASGTGLAVGISTAAAVGEAIREVHVGKWHVVNKALAVLPQGAFSDGFSDGFDINLAIWQEAIAKPEFQTSWRVANEVRAPVPTGIWKVANAKPNFGTQGSFSKDFSADFEGGGAVAQKWRVVPGGQTPKSPAGAFDNGFDDGFEITPDTMWKIAA